MKKFIFAIATVVSLGAVSCSHNNQKNEETAQVEEEGIGCLCCPVEEAPADSIEIPD